MKWIDQTWMNKEKLTNCKFTALKKKKKSTQVLASLWDIKGYEHFSNIQQEVLKNNNNEKQFFEKSNKKRNRTEGAVFIEAEGLMNWREQI